MALAITTIVAFGLIFLLWPQTSNQTLTMNIQEWDAEYQVYAASFSEGEYNFPSLNEGDTVLIKGNITKMTIYETSSKLYIDDTLLWSTIKGNLSESFSVGDFVTVTLTIGEGIPNPVSFPDIKGELINEAPLGGSLLQSVISKG